MIDNYGRILFGFQIKEDVFYSKLEEYAETLCIEEQFQDVDDVFDWFDETYLYDSGCTSEVNYICDPMSGKIGYFGVILHSCDLDKDYDEAFEIPLETHKYLDIMNNFANHHKTLYGLISECSIHSTPKMLFAITKS